MGGSLQQPGQGTGQAPSFGGFGTKISNLANNQPQMVNGLYDPTYVAPSAPNQPTQFNPNQPIDNTMPVSYLPSNNNQKLIFRYPQYRQQPSMYKPAENIRPIDNSENIRPINNRYVPPQPPFGYSQETFQNPYGLNQSQVYDASNNPLYGTQSPGQFNNFRQQNRPKKRSDAIFEALFSYLGQSR